MNGEVYKNTLDRYYVLLMEEATTTGQRPLPYVLGRKKSFWKKRLLQSFLIGPNYRLTSTSL